MRYLFITFSIFLLPLFPTEKAQNICMISLAKSGTHLCRKALNTLTNYDRKYWLWYLDTLPVCSKNQYIGCHFYKNQRLEQLDHPNMKYIINIRDIRDIIVSAAYYYDYPPFSDLRFSSNTIDMEIYKQLLVKWKHAYPTQRIEMILDDSIALSDPLVGFYNAIQWLKDHLHLKDNIIIVRFEDLVGSRGNQSNLSQIETLKKLASFLGVKMSDSKIEALAKTLYHKDSGTFRKGKTKEYQNEFSPLAHERFELLGAKELQYFESLSLD